MSKRATTYRLLPLRGRNSLTVCCTLLIANVDAITQVVSHLSHQLFSLNLSRPMRLHTLMRAQR